MSDTGKVNIHGKEYTTVAARVQQFRDKFPKYALETKIEWRDETEVVMKASISDESGRLIATGHAEERRSSSQINRTSALENCETSAIGRALAAFGMAGTEFASADEVAQAISQQKPAVGTSPLASPTQKAQLKAFLMAKRIRDEDMAQYIIDNFGIDPATMTKLEAVAIMKDLQ